MHNHNYGLSDNLVLVYDAPNQTASEIVCATLKAAGIQAYVQNTNRGPASGALPHLGLAYPHGVLVAPGDAPAARALLEAQTPTDDELAFEAEADPISLEEAEARVR